MIIIGCHGVTGDLAGAIERQGQLLVDLKEIAAGLGPTADQLAASPLIDQWTEAIRPEPCLVGQTHGHPYCRALRSVTSGLIVWAPDLGWMRTASRYYTLGRPLAAGPPS